MSKSETGARLTESTLLKYGLAVLCVAAAVAITEVLRNVIDTTPLLFAAVLLGTWFGGRGPGLFAVLLATLAFDYFFVQPFYTLTLGVYLTPRFAVFVMSALLISWLSDKRKRAEGALRQARDEMEVKVEERTADLKQANEQLQAEVAERRRVEEVLRERAGLLDLTHDTVFVRDLNDVITYWNRGAEELYGWSKEEALGKVSHNLTQTVFPAPLKEISEELFGTGRWEGELVHTKRDGTRVVVASRWSLQRDERGNPVAVLETNNDITERRRAEDALRESEEQWRAVFENNPTMYFMVDAAGTILSVNPFGAEKLGYTVGELVGSPVLNVFYEADREAVERNVAVCLERLDQAMNWEARKVRKDGTVLWVRETAKAVLLKNRPVVLVACEDITERKHAEEELQKAQAELAHVARVTTMGELASSIAHEVNQPLAAIVTNANACLRWLAGDPPNLEEARETVGRIVRDGHRASEVVGRVRALFRKAAPAKERLDINGLIRDVLALVPGELRRNRVVLRTELAPELPAVAGDRVQLQQVLLNLIINGVEAMSGVSDRPRKLLVRSERHGRGGVLVAVEDSGVGLEAEDSSQIFDAFYTTKPEGLGMGLSISRTTVEAHGGRLWATPNDPQGATFQFTLPADGEGVLE